MNNTQRLASLDRLLADVPKFECRPGCSDCCGPVIMSRLEMKRICERTGLTERDLDFLTVMERGGSCPLLKDNRCSVYDIRPAICKVFGSSLHKRLICPHGCAPAVPMAADLTDGLIDASERLGHGFPPHSDALPKIIAKAGQSADHFR